MDRRHFLKTAGFGAAALVLKRSLSASAASGGTLSAERILDKADDRIEKYRKADAVLRLVTAESKPFHAGLTVRIEQTCHRFLFGCNIFKLGLCRKPDENTAYEQRFSDLLNFATLPFYWWNYEREQGKPEDGRTEQIVRWCEAHNITMKGHPLAWNYRDPSWLPNDPTEVMKLQFERIARCVQKFKGDIDIWDVVNEATHYDRDSTKRQAPILTEAIRRIGVGAYIRGAFRTARKANPAATLLINDYRTDPAYAEKVISQLVDNGGQPLYDVIGIQSHMHSEYWGAKRAWEVCERFAKFGKPLHFTETTVISGPKTEQSWMTTPQGERRQAEQVAEFYRVLYSHPAVEAITWWDFTDQGAWQRAPAGLTRADMTPKPAYEQLHQLIKEKWWTQAEATIAADGNVRFRGFLGQYKIIAEAEGRKLTGTFKLDKGARQVIEVQLG